VASENDQDTDLEATSTDGADAADSGEGASDDAAAVAPAKLAPEARKALTAGERLAAAKAAKHAQKAAKAAARKVSDEPAEEEEVEDEVQVRAEAATSWVHDHQATIVKVLAGAAVLSAVVLGVQYFSGTTARAAGSLMSSALMVAASPVGEAQEGEVLRPGEERYADEAARDAALLAAYQRVAADEPDSEAAAWARLALGRFKLEAGEFSDARALFEAALGGADGNLTLRSAAIEGVGFSHEGEEAWDEAATQYERLAGLGGAYEQVAALHQARVLLAKGERATAIERLQALIEALRAEDAPPLTYVRDQAELTLMSLDASLVQRSAAPSGLDSLPPEILEQLLRQQGAR
jgi:tetratricopeptide (TPR) repeat protein